MSNARTVAQTALEAVVEGGPSPKSVERLTDDLQTNHSPAPWRKDRVYLVDCDGYGIASMLGEHADPSDADFRLLVAAPDLLEACEEQNLLIAFYGRLLAHYRTGSRPSESTLDEVNKAASVTDKARAAIRKAKEGK